MIERTSSMVTNLMPRAAWALMRETAKRKEKRS
jgi:hypothetical protein